MCYKEDAALYHSTAGERIGRSLQREATWGQQSTTILSESALRVDAHWLGCIAINVRSEYSSTLSQKVEAFRPLPQNAMLGPGVTPGNLKPP